MDKKINIDMVTLKALYMKHKELLLPVGVIIVCVFLFISVIVPQFQNIFSLKDKYDEETNNISVLKNNLNLLSNMDEAKLDGQLQLVSKALPPDKDFAGILNAISYVANTVGVSVGEFEFDVGNISKPDKVMIQGYPSLKVTLSIDGGAIGMANFINKLYKTLPLAEISSVQTSSSQSTVTILFYYKPFPPINFNDTSPINTISTMSLDLMDDLSKWGNQASEIPLNLPAASSSSSLNSF